MTIPLLTQCTLLGVLELEVLVWELGSVDGLAAGAVVVGEVTSLDHKVLDDTVESASLRGCQSECNGTSCER